MAQLEILTCSSPKSRGILIDEVNGTDQTHCNASAELWLNQVKSRLDSRDKMWQVSRKVCIYKVPQSLMISKREAYIPLVVSLGPYNHKISHKFSMIDQHKFEAVHRMLERLEIDMARLIEEIEQLESDIRECYDEPINLDGKTLSYMLAMDACFILEFLRRESYPGYHSLVFSCNSNSTYCEIHTDIMKLENQIPLFVLIKILQLECGTFEHAIAKLADILSNHTVFRGEPFSLLAYDDCESKVKELMMTERRPYHLLDLYRMVIRDLLTNSSAQSATSIDIDGNGDADNGDDHEHSRWSMNMLLPGWIQQLSCMDGCGVAHNMNNRHRWCGWWRNVRLPDWMQRLRCIHIRPCLCLKRSPDDSRSTPSAKLLKKAGIKFQQGPLRFEKSWFGRGTLYLPQITVEDETETLLRNLMAYEECQRRVLYPEVTVISYFVGLLDSLIDSEQDVSVLRKSLVIRSFLGSDERIASMFNSLCDGITLNSIENFELVMKETRDHYSSQWKVWISQFKEEHCSKPWYILSIVAAILILSMTAVQTVFSVKK